MDEGLDEEGHVSEAFERCWTPLHAAAAAMARARRTRDGRAFAWVPARISAAARSALETAVGAVAGASFARRLFVSRAERDAGWASTMAPVSRLGCPPRAPACETKTAAPVPRRSGLKAARMCACAGATMLGMSEASVLCIA